jgi:pimeloyl-ACP methyl ester carboxylesterase
MTARIGMAMALGFATLCAANAQTPTPSRPPAEAFAVLPPEEPQISPDGTHFAAIRGVNGRPALAIYSVDEPTTPPEIITSGNWLIAGKQWVKNDALLIYSKKNMQLGVYDAFNQNMLRPLGDAAFVLLKEKKLVELSAISIVDVDLDDPDTIYGMSDNSLYRINVRVGGQPKLFMKKYIGPEHEGTDSWYLDGHGHAIARIDKILDQRDYDGNARRGVIPLWHHRLKLAENGTWRQMATYDATVDVGDGIKGVAEDGKAFIRFAPHESGTASVNRIDIVSGAESTLFQDPAFDPENALKDEWTGAIIGYSVDEDMPSYTYFDPKREALQKGLEQAFPGMSVYAVSTDLQRDRAIVAVVGPRTPVSYYLFDRTTHRATAVAASYPDLKESDFGEVRTYGYTAQDGLHIPAYLTLPPNRTPHGLPLVVLPHGGPDARDDMSFDFLSQFLANRGYAVLRPQFRGSAGYGRPFTVAGFHQWGLKMQDDISDGVKRAIADGIVDPKRVCIFGASSYGGYAALAGATMSPDLYACAISFEGVSDLEAFLGYERKAFHINIDIPGGSYQELRIGDLFKDAARLRETSPVLHADRVKAPVLLLHSELDVTVPIEQSEMMNAALQKAGKKVEFVRIPGDDHYMTLEQTRLRVLQEVEKFLAAHIGS